MSWLDGLRHRVRGLLRPGDWARELDEEMRFHHELGAMQAGDADAARRRFGNRTYHAEETRLMTWLRFTDTLRQDFGSAWRSMRRAPALTALIVTTLALGIGANAATFTLLDTLFIKEPAGVQAPGGLRRFYLHHARSFDGVPFYSQALNVPTYQLLAGLAGDTVPMALYRTEDALRLGRGLGGPKVRVVYATANYFDVLGVRPALGRVYLPDEDRFGAGADVAVVSDAFWRRELGGSPAALGGTFRIGRDTYTVVGILPPAFTGLDLQAADVWIPFASSPVASWMPARWWESIRMNGYRAVARWPARMDAAAFEARATTALRAFEVERRRASADTLIALAMGGIKAADGPSRPGQELVITTRLAGVAAIVLLIAWANVINLLLARAVQRRREIAVRLALGISRARLVRLLTLETLLLALAAAAGALLVGWGGGSALRRLVLPDVEWLGPALDGRIALFTLVVAASSGLAAGLVPALQASRPSLTGALKEGAREGGMRRSRLRAGLLAAQAALTVLLLVGAGLFVRSLRNVQGLDIGYDSGRLLFGRMAFADGEAPDRPALVEGMRGVAARLADRPGVEVVARAGFEPMQGLSWLDFFTATDSSGRFGGDLPVMSAVTPTYFRATGIRLLRGEGFSGGDAADPPREVVVSEAAARLLWPGGEPLGQCLRFRTREAPCFTVTGVVEDVRLGSVIETKQTAQYYVPLGSDVAGGFGGGTIIVRATAGAGEAAAEELRGALSRAFPTGLANVSAMTAALEPEYRPWRLGATLFSGMGVLALVVAVIGIYSTVSYGVSQRTHEFGVRMALGARLGHVLRQVVGEGLRTVAVGVAAGVALALAAGRLIAALLYGVSPSDPLVLALVVAALLGVAALAALVPAWRAARVDPVRALRAE